jgi:uncharacterized membrane protein YhaH (DUF805 family)
VKGSLDEPPILVTANRARAVWLVAGSAVLLTFGALGVSSGVNAATLFSMALFGLFGAMGLWMLIAPSQLEIGPAGLKQRVLWRTSRYAWTDIYDFRPTTVGLFRKTVGFDFLKPNPGRDGLRKFNSAMTGVQAVLQSGWELDPGALAALLNQARERWIGDQANPASAVAYTAPSAFAGFAGNRLDRKTYLIASAVLFALAVGLGFLPAVARGAGGAFTLFFIRLYAVRLHDLGRSGWWQVTVYGAQIVVLVGVLMAGGQSTDLAVGAAFLIQLLFTGLLGVFPGQLGENRFGPAPGQPSAVRQAEFFR